MPWSGGHGLGLGIARRSGAGSHAPAYTSPPAPDGWAFGPARAPPRPPHPPSAPHCAALPLAHPLLRLAHAGSTPPATAQVGRPATIAQPFPGNRAFNPQFVVLTNDDSVTRWGSLAGDGAGHGRVAVPRGSYGVDQPYACPPRPPGSNAERNRAERNAPLPRHRVQGGLRRAAFCAGRQEVTQRLQGRRHAVCCWAPRLGPGCAAGLPGHPTPYDPWPAGRPASHCANRPLRALSPCLQTAAWFGTCTPAGRPLGSTLGSCVPLSACLPLPCRH